MAQKGLVNGRSKTRSKVKIRIRRDLLDTRDCLSFSAGIINLCLRRGIKTVAKHTLCSHIYKHLTGAVSPYCPSDESPHTGKLVLVFYWRYVSEQQYLSLHLFSLSPGNDTIYWTMISCDTVSLDSTGIPPVIAPPTKSAKRS